MNMKTSTVNLYSLSFSERRTFLFSFIFIIGNITVPQFFHLVPQGGQIWLPIYFFTLIGAYKYGWQVGIITALCSPIINSLLWGMPASSVLPCILIKSVLLSVSASFIAKKTNIVSIPSLAVVVIFYQVVGSLIESVIVNSLYLGFQDFRIGIPGMLLQIIGGYIVIKYIFRK